MNLFIWLSCLVLLTTAQSPPLPTDFYEVIDPIKCDEYKTIWLDCQAPWSSIHAVYATTPMPLPDKCKRPWHEYFRVCGWPERLGGQSDATMPSTPVNPAPTFPWTPPALEKRDWTCPQGYHYLTKPKDNYDYYYCCPNADDQMLLPEDFSAPPVCCKKGALPCNGESVSISDWCRNGQEVTQQGGIAGCRALQSASLRKRNNNAFNARIPQDPTAWGGDKHCPEGYGFFQGGTADEYRYSFCCPWFADKLQLPSLYTETPRCCHGHDGDCSILAQSMLEDGECQYGGEEITDWNGVKGCRKELKKRESRSVEARKNPPLICDTKPCAEGWHEVHIGDLCHCALNVPAPTEPHLAPTHDFFTGFIRDVNARDGQYPSCNPFGKHTQRHGHGPPPWVSSMIGTGQLPPCRTTMETFTKPNDTISTESSATSVSGTTTTTVTLLRSTSAATTVLDTHAALTVLAKAEDTPGWMTSLDYDYPFTDPGGHAWIPIPSGLCSWCEGNARYGFKPGWTYFSYMEYAESICSASATACPTPWQNSLPTSTRGH